MPQNSSHTAFNSPLLIPLAYLGLLALLILAGVFYQERTLFTDIPYQTVLMINDGSVQVQNYRFGSAIVQFLPVLAIWLKMPVAAILFLYSVSFPLVYLLFFILIVHLFKNQYLGWALVFLFTLITFDGFYWPNSEQQQGLAFLLVFFAGFYRYPKFSHWVHWLLAIVGLIAIAYYHPLNFITFYFLLAFFWLSNSRYRHRNTLLLALAMVVILVAKSKLAANYYDDGKYDVFIDNLIAHFPNYLAFTSNQKFITNVWKFWYFLPILFAVVIGFYLFRKQWWKALLVFTFCIGTLLLLHIGSPKASYRFYAEVNYMPLVLFLVIPFLFDIVPAIRSPKLLLTLFAAVLFLRLNTIYHNHQPYRERIDWVKTTMTTQSEKYAGSQLWIEKEKIPMDMLKMSWGVAYESLLLSAMDGDEISKTLVILNHPNSKKQQELASDSLFVSEIRVHPKSEFNRDYFIFPKEKYVEIENLSQ